jgi:hypothetical protein
MALYMDGPVSTIEDLRAEDSQLNDLASIEGVDVTQKLALAKEDVGFDLERLLDGKQPLGKVLLTRALQVWHVYRTLEMMYRDAYFTHLNDRYKKKRNQFHELAKDAREHVIHRGLEIVLNPVRRAATPALATTTGTLPAGIYYATITWLNRDGAEGQPAAPDAIQVTTGGFTVTPGDPVPTAVAWNVYVGGGPDCMTLQNVVPLSISAAWPQTSEPTTNGRVPGTGQPADYIQPAPRVLPRG